MKLKLLFFLLFFNLFSGCKRTEKYSKNYFIQNKNVVYGILNFGSNGKMISKKILDKDSLRQFVENLNNSEYVGICKSENATGSIAIVAKDTGVIRLDIIDNKIRIPVLNKCYKLKKRLNTSR